MCCADVLSACVSLVGLKAVTVKGMTRIASHRIASQHTTARSACVHPRVYCISLIQLLLFIFLKKLSIKKKITIVYL